MKGRVFLTLFALPFAGIGAWMLWSVSGMLSDAYRMQDWQPVQAQVDDAGYHTRRGDDSDSYEAYARYRYTVGGVAYTSERVGIGSGADNIGDYQQAMGRRLSKAASESRPITAYVDLDNPANAVIDRSVRWEMIGFRTIFVLLFGGVGVGGLVFLWWPRKSAPANEAGLADAPWLRRDAWRSPTIRSGSRTAMWGAWAFAVVWNLISAPTPFIAWTEVVDKQNHLALLALLFPLVGIGLLAWAGRRTLEWRRFGPAPVSLDPFPGSIGGHVGGTIDLALGFASTRRFDVSLACLRSYVSGSGKNRRRRESAQWQDSRIAHAEPAGGGTRLTFRFDVPAGLPEADAGRDESTYYLWRLNVHAELPGADLDRSYDIPVYATATRSASLPEQALTETHNRHQNEAQSRLERVLRIERSFRGNRLHLPMGRHLGAALGGFTMGAVFAGVGGYLLWSGESAVIGAVFGAVGVLIALGCLYLALNSLEVFRMGEDIVSVRRVLGIPVARRRLRLAFLAGLEPRAGMKSQTGGKHVIHYSIRAVDRNGNQIIVGEGFRGDSEARAAMALIARELGLEAPRTSNSALPDELDISVTG